MSRISPSQPSRYKTHHSDAILHAPIWQNTHIPQLSPSLYKGYGALKARARLQTLSPEDKKTIVTVRKLSDIYAKKNSDTIYFTSFLVLNKTLFLNKSNQGFTSFLEFSSRELSSLGSAKRAKTLRLIDIRIYLALREMAHRRRFIGKGREPDYKISEIQKLTGIRDRRRIRASVRRLERAGFATIREKSCTFSLPKDIAPDSEPGVNKKVRIPRKALSWAMGQRKLGTVAAFLTVYSRKMDNRLGRAVCKAQTAARLFNCSTKSINRGLGLMRAAQLIRKAPNLNRRMRVRQHGTTYEFNLNPLPEGVSASHSLGAGTVRQDLSGAKLSTLFNSSLLTESKKNTRGTSKVENDRIRQLPSQCRHRSNFYKGNNQKNQGNNANSASQAPATPYQYNPHRSVFREKAQPTWSSYSPKEGYQPPTSAAAPYQYMPHRRPERPKDPRLQPKDSWHVLDIRPRTREEVKAMYPISEGGMRIMKSLAQIMDEVIARKAPDRSPLPALSSRLKQIKASYVEDVAKNQPYYPEDHPKPPTVFKSAMSEAELMERKRQLREQYERLKEAGL